MLVPSAVSYTHLDVYKRQEHTIVGIRTDATIIVVFSQPHEYLFLSLIHIWIFPSIYKIIQIRH